VIERGQRRGNGRHSRRNARVCNRYNTAGRSNRVTDTVLILRRTRVSSIERDIIVIVCIRIISVRCANTGADAMFLEKSIRSAECNAPT